ncbi:MAG: GDSL-type esterase/lipase family protein [Bacteriovoracaceae bacterium]|nr:GDSL-type esterase/lipase family protein [Bacteriovoracaceae bacterium]
MKIFLLFLLLILIGGKNNFSFAAKNILFLGDSITEGYGVATEKAYTSLLEQKWKKEGKDGKVVVSAISGSTTATGLERFKWIAKRPEIFHKMILFLGGNDVLRSIAAKETKKNLLETLKEMNLYAKKYPKEEMEIYLVELKIPKNYGAVKVQEWNSLYRELSKEVPFTLIPFPLADIVLKKELNLADGIHPNEIGHEKLANFFYDYFKTKGKW